MRSPDRLSPQALSVVSDGSLIREISSVSISEIGIKYSNRKLDVAQRSVLEGIEDLELRTLPYTAVHAYLMFDLPLHHRDPFDRQIIAQAIFENMRIVTPDVRFDAYANLSRIW